MKIRQAEGRWQNWSGSQQARPEIIQVQHLQHLQDIVKSSPQIRAVGAGHSFSALATTDNILVNLDHLRGVDRKSTRLNSSHLKISYAVFCLKKKTRNTH